MVFLKGLVLPAERKFKICRTKGIKNIFREKSDEILYNQESIRKCLPDKYSVKIADDLYLRLIFLEYIP